MKNGFVLLMFLLFLFSCKSEKESVLEKELVNLSSKLDTEKDLIDSLRGQKKKKRAEFAELYEVQYKRLDYVYYSNCFKKAHKFVFSDVDFVTKTFEELEKQGVHSRANLTSTLLEGMVNWRWYDEDPIYFYWNTFSRTSTSLEQFFSEDVIDEVVLFVLRNNSNSSWDMRELLRLLIEVYQQIDSEGERELRNLYLVASGYYKGDYRYADVSVEEVIDGLMFYESTSNVDFSKLKSDALSYVFQFWSRRLNENNAVVVYEVLKKIECKLSNCNESNEREF